MWGGGYWPIRQLLEKKVSITEVSSQGPLSPIWAPQPSLGAPFHLPVPQNPRSLHASLPHTLRSLHHRRGWPVTLPSPAAHRPPCDHSSGWPLLLKSGRVGELPPVPGPWPSWPQSGSSLHAHWPRGAHLQLADEFSALPPYLWPPPAGVMRDEENVAAFPHTQYLLTERGEAFGTQAHLGGWSALHQETGQK